MHWITPRASSVCSNSGDVVESFTLKPRQSSRYQTDATGSFGSGLGANEETVSGKKRSDLFLSEKETYYCVFLKYFSTPCHHIWGGTWWLYRHFKHALKGQCLGYSRPRRIVTNLLSCALEDYLLAYLLLKRHHVCNMCLCILENTLLECLDKNIRW